MTRRLASLVLCLAACSSSSSQPDGGTCGVCDAPDIDAFVDLPDGAPPDGPRPVDLWNHFTLEVTPTSPVQGEDFTVEVHAYSSNDTSAPLVYDGTLSVITSCGVLTGDNPGPITAGVATLTLQSATAGAGCELTVTDQTWPSMSAITTVDILPQGDTASLRDVVINEVNWFGNAASANDEWIELRNRTGAAINLSTWTIDNAGAGALALPLGTTIAANGYLLVARLQGPDSDGQRTSLTGVSDVLIALVDLVNAGEQLVLRDRDGTLIDQTPGAPWPAGNNTDDLTMERRDELSGGGYLDGSLPGAWYTFNPFGGSDASNADSSDQGTPGAANSTPPQLIYATGFEGGDPTWVKAMTSTAFDVNNTPPAGTSARTGTQILYSKPTPDDPTKSLTTSFSSRLMGTSDCIALPDGVAPISATAYGTAGTSNGDNVVRGRLLIRWFTDAGCTTSHATAASTGASVVFPQGSYAAVTLEVAPPDATATHITLVIDAHDTSGATTPEDAWALDDVTIFQ
ncbi:MAG TPA: lamin tail domain-containing protein [Kofleriaceae bacterium]|nr:lamin tail domain-containing protein [Kofleriaceae bacterium]